MPDKDRQVRAELIALREMVQRIDVAIRGNDKPGIQTRLDRLEVAEKRRGRLMWILVAASVTIAVAAVKTWIAGG